MTSSIPPAFVFLVAAVLVLLLPGGVRRLLVPAVPLLGGINLWFLWQGGGAFEVPLLDTRLTLLRADSLSLLFGLLFHIAAFLGAIFAFHVRDRLQQSGMLLYAGSALGAVFAGDLITLVIFWEGATLGSVLLILARREPRAVRAAMRYLVFQLVSGLLLLGGAIIVIGDTGSAAFGHIGIGSLGGVLIFVAFGIKCGFPLVHTWLTDAYPESTPTGMVFLSAFTTKLAVYALARGYAGTEVLIPIGTAMTAFPIFYAVIENDLRRVLAYSMINQIGFMVVGIGIGTSLALNGAVSHAFNDVIFKGLLLMSMGAVLHQTGKINGSELGGLYKSMPQTTGLCIVGAASISAFPLFSGFVSKSMVMSAAAAEGYWIIWILLLFASAGVFHHAGIKIPYFAFFAHDSGIRTREPPLNMRIAMAMAAILCIVIGCYPAWLYSLSALPGGLRALYRQPRAGAGPASLLLGPRLRFPQPGRGSIRPSCVRRISTATGCTGAWCRAQRAGSKGRRPPSPRCSGSSPRAASIACSMRSRSSTGRAGCWRAPGPLAPPRSGSWCCLAPAWSSTTFSGAERQQGRGRRDHEDERRVPGPDRSGNGVACAQRPRGPEGMPARLPGDREDLRHRDVRDACH